MSKWLKISASGLFLIWMAYACQPAVREPVDTSTPTQPVFQAQTIAPEATLTSPIQEAATMTPHLNEAPVPTPFDAYTQKLVEQAKGDLAQRLSVNPDQIEVVETSEVTWPDGSLGCPEPGMMYTQVTVDGLRIRLNASGKIYSYHSGGSRPPFLCENS